MRGGGVRGARRRGGGVHRRILVASVAPAHLAGGYDPDACSRTLTRPRPQRPTAGPRRDIPNGFGLLFFFLLGFGERGSGGQWCVVVGSGGYRCVKLSGRVSRHTTYQ